MLFRHSALRAASFALALAPVVLVVACSGNTATDSATVAVSADEAQALSGAQESYATQKAETAACKATFEACKAAAGADLAACKAALHACLPDIPPPPPRCGGRGGAGHPPPPPSGSAGGPPPPPSGSAGGPPPPPSGSAGGPPPPPSGSAGEPPPPAPSGSGTGTPPPAQANLQPASAAGGTNRSGGDRGGEERDCDGGKPRGGKGGPKGLCERIPLPAREALKACHDTLEACVEGGGDREACFTAERACVRAAFQAAFQARCASLPTNAPAEAVARCAEGIEPPAASTGN